MTCESIRTALLVAELSELRGEGTGELATHLRSCASCREEAARILTATGALSALVQRRRRRANWIRVALPLAAAAGVAFWLAPSNGPGPAPTPTGAIATGPSRVPAAARPAPSTVPSATASGRARRSAVRAAPVVPSGFEGSAPVVAVAFVATPLPAAPLRASAPEPARKRPKVVPTSDPAITLLWFE